MIKLTRSIASGLAIGYGAVLAGAIALLAIAFYAGTIGVLNQATDTKIITISRRLSAQFARGQDSGLATAIRKQLNDGVDSDTEIFLLLSPDDKPVAGNLSRWPDAATKTDYPLTRTVSRNDEQTEARLIIRRLSDGYRLIVGKDLQEQQMIGELVIRSILVGMVLSICLVVAGAILFRRLIESRIGHIRHIAHEIERGDLSRRIPASNNDEFGRLGVDINRMLDRIEHLMEGVRHVSNAIAHDLRTPLTRLRNKLDEAIGPDADLNTLPETFVEAVQDIDDLIRLFEKLLQIAEAESGVRTQVADPIDLARIVQDMVELYDATAEAAGVVLIAHCAVSVPASGDRNLLANALASLIDNAIKHTAAGSHVHVSAFLNETGACLEVRDDGPGIPADALTKVTERFFRLDQSRHLPGNGIGLSVVLAIATLHGGSLQLESASPGLVARLFLPVI
ncbi:hypothetical protein AEAC466_18180 [Asticcacaulis sp. AC466]|uniref:sensor histidine kinase n=1 Tax=Asticcacaulis sp. AC466 TaxID=1282362 RepID=UPI0003C3D504|nr:HAMP domain-containing sensor histidine kinase [Asticcacaulis sp. AC466]ESQ82275.1 hypothetical protein AEAC466_18180 [Asticcacaulis sp. AC466]